MWVLLLVLGVIWSGHLAGAWQDRNPDIFGRDVPEISGYLRFVPRTENGNAAGITPVLGRLGLVNDAKCNAQDECKIALGNASIDLSLSGRFEANRSLDFCAESAARLLARHKNHAPRSQFGKAYRTLNECVSLLITSPEPAGLIGSQVEAHELGGRFADIFSQQINNTVNLAAFDPYFPGLGRNLYPSSMLRHKGPAREVYGFLGGICLPDTGSDSKSKLLLTRGVQEHGSDAQSDSGERQDPRKDHKPERVIRERFVGFFFFGLGCFIGGALFMLGSYAALRHVASVHAKEETRAKRKSHQPSIKRPNNPPFPH